MNYIYLSILTVVAVDWLIRIIVYSKTGNEKCKHDFIWWK